MTCQNASRICWMLCLLLLGNCAMAKENPTVVHVIAGEQLRDMVSSHSPLEFQLDGINAGNVGQLNSTERRTSYKNQVALRMTDHTNLAESLRVTLKADVVYFMIDRTNEIKSQITLQLDYRSGALQKSSIEHIYAFENAYHVVLTVTELKAETSMGDGDYKLVEDDKWPEIQPWIEVNVNFTETTKRKLNYAQSPTGLNHCEDISTDELVIYWDDMPDAEAYELEYTFVDDYTSVSGGYANPKTIQYDFHESATRIATKENNYRFPLVAEQGWFLYRVRKIGYGDPNFRILTPGTWTGQYQHGWVADFPDKYHHLIAHMSDGMNWQLMTTFAEEGKRSDMVTYMDGTFRERQEVTAMNLEPQHTWEINTSGFTVSLGNQPVTQCQAPASNKVREVIAGETIYDFQGRAAVNILPVPTDDKILHFIPKLNLADNDQTPYNWEDFDAASYTCPHTEPLYPKPYGPGSIMGAAAYYSPNNPKLYGFNAFIPNAEKFPFTQVAYLQDNTGRVAAQSGVGKTFQFGGNHETRFYYAAPMQTEIDRLFGTEAGDAVRYQKNAVRDPNGQVSVTILNPEGKTIATALAGETPPNLDALPSQKPETIHESLIHKNQIGGADHKRILEHQFMVTSDNTEYTFDYGLDPALLNYTTCDGKEVCLDCIYDFSISLYHNESCTVKPLFSFTGTIGELFNATGAVDLGCENSSTASFKHHEVVKLNVGTYTLTKTLHVNEAAAQAYMAEVFKDTCRDKWNALLKEEMSKVDTMECYKNCLQCKQPPQLSDDCDTNFCKPAPNRCDLARTMMAADLTPGGQYAQVDHNPDGTIDASKYPLSIFNPNNVLPKAKLADINKLLMPQQFSTLEALYQRWKPEYGTKLISLHPEQCLLDWCKDRSIDKTLDFDMSILTTAYFTDARDKGYVDLGKPLPNADPKPYEKLLLADPFFANGQNSTMRNELLYKLQHFGCPGHATIPADELAMRAAYCAQFVDTKVPQPTKPVQSQYDSGCKLPDNYFGTHAFGTDPNLADLEWQMLRAIYLSVKSVLLQGHQNDYITQRNQTKGDCSCRCIGLEAYKTWMDAHPPFLANGLSKPPCHAPSAANWQLYADKQSRFGSGVDNIMKAWKDEGMTFDATGITNFDDPCQFANALMGQIPEIREAFKKYDCDTVFGGSVQTAQTPELPSLRQYLDAIFRFNQLQARFPFDPELLAIATFAYQPPIGLPLTNVTSNNTPQKFEITHTYGHAPRVFTCTITLTANPSTNPWNWKFIRSVDNIVEDFSNFHPDGPRKFVLTVRYSEDFGATNKMVDIQATSSCWPFLQPVNTLTVVCDSFPLDDLPPQPYHNDCVESLLRLARNNAQLRYRQCEDSLKADLLQKYYAKCMDAHETMDMQYIDLQYHYTLYYYDQAGNLVKTVPPAGVRPLENSKLADVKASRAAGFNTPVLPDHYKQTHYHYNTLNELVWQKTPDAGESEFLYDGLGRIVASQNAQQRQDGNVYAYTCYDAQGRMVETGKVKTNTPITPAIAHDFKTWTTFINGQSNRSEITFTQYDKSWNPDIKNRFRNRKQENLFLRVGSVFTFETYAKLQSRSYSHATHYSYDIEGNVKELIQDFRNGVMGAKSIAYDYDLQSGKVNEVIYQSGKPDQYIHHYEYDAANRLTQVRTSRDSIVWETDATYLYYRHGPLARMELGTDKVQGLDYLYTLQGWIKGVNGTTETANFDMGQDGVALSENATPTFNWGTGAGSGSGTYTVTTNTIPPGYRDMHHPVAKDAFGYVLSYFEQDYSPIEWGATGMANSSSVSYPPNRCLDLMPQPMPGTEALYNGNICKMYTQIQGLGHNGFSYSYDQLNRIKDSEAWTVDGNGIVTPRAGDAYRGMWTYDADGNILNQFRNGDEGHVAMDKMDYFYYRSNGSTYNPVNGIPADATNRLAYVDDITVENPADDIDDQDPSNYTYDLIGNLISDKAENIDKITWNLQNKVASIEKSAGADLVFQYDALGQRIEKTVTNGTDAENASTYYVRDAQGNIMATYSYRVPPGSTTTTKVLYLDEVDLHGSSRLGVDSLGLAMDLSQVHQLPDPQLPGSLPEPRWQYALRERGDIRFELCNHLGNVLAVISDRKLPAASPEGTYVADVLSAQDYYAFGMVMPGRSLAERVDRTDGYRYGFMGYEADNEVKGSANSYTTEFREYDPLLGRWLSLDPLMGSFPWQSPYVAFDNNPIYHTDPQGAASEGGDDKSKKFNNNKDGSRSYDNGNGTSTYDAPGFQNVTLEKGAKIVGTFQDVDGNGKINLGKKDVQASVGDVKEFEVNGISYDAKFNGKGQFSGYWDDKGNKYEPPTPKEKDEPTLGPEALRGPTLLFLSYKKYNFLKPVGALGSKKGSTIASYTLGKAIPQKFTNVLGKKIGTKTATYIGTNTIGRAAGRYLIPFGGQAMTIYDVSKFVIKNRAAFGEGVRLRDEYIQQGLMPLR